MLVVLVPVVVAPLGEAVMVHVPVEGSPLISTLPVGVAQSGSVTVPTIGAVGTDGAGLMVASKEATDAQPLLSATEKVYVFGFKPLTVPVVPLPVIVEPPGDAVMIHVPVFGSPLNCTLPVLTVQVGCVIVPITGAVGVPGAALIVALVVDAAEVHPEALVTVKVYVPGESPLKAAVVMLPVIVLPFDAVTVHVPDDGSPLSATEPVGVEQVGCVMVPSTGAVGVVGAASITAFNDAVDVQVPLFTVKVYVPGVKLDRTVVVPLPLALPLGVPVIVHVPVDGSPVNCILPVPTVQVG